MANLLFQKSQTFQKPYWLDSFYKPCFDVLGGLILYTLSLYLLDYINKTKGLLSSPYVYDFYILSDNFINLITLYSI